MDLENFRLRMDIQRLGVGSLVVVVIGACVDPSGSVRFV